jgi:hypothetical protein
VALSTKRRVRIVGCQWICWAAICAAHLVAAAAPPLLVKFEAESGARGSAFAISNGNPAYITSTINPARQPLLSSAGVVTLTATGIVGPDYTLLISTNLVDWQSLITTNPAAMPVTFTDTNRNDLVRFYRLQLGP